MSIMFGTIKKQILIISEKLLTILLGKELYEIAHCTAAHNCHDNNKKKKSYK